MNEQAIQDSYNLFVQQGYKKSIDDFKQLISTNPEALNDSFGLFQKEGYNKSIEDYKNLMGVGAQPTLKKKEPTTTASSLAGTSSDLSSEQNLNPFAKNTVGIPQPAPTKTVAPQQAIQPTEGFATAPTETITETIAPVKTKKQELEDILKNVKITEEVPVIKPFDKETEKILSEGPKSKRTSLASNYSDNLALGLGTLSKMVVSIPEATYNLFAAPQNAVAWATGLDIQTNADEFGKTLGIENPVLQAINREQEFTSKRIETFNKENYKNSSVYENIKDGNYSDAFELMGAGIIQSAPVSVAMMYGGTALTKAEYLAAGTASFFEGNYEELGKENPNMSEIEKTIKSVGMASAETFFNLIGLAPIGQVYKTIIAKEGVEAGKVIFKDGLVQAYKTALKKYGAPIGLLGEGLEEAATQVTQNMISGKPANQGVADAFIIGSGSGGVFTAPITAAQGIQKVQNLTKDYQAKSTINTILKDKDVELTQVYNVPKADKFTPEQIDIANTDRSRDILRKNLLSQLRSGDITKADAKQSLYVFDKVQQVSNNVKDLNISSTEKAEVANLLSERNELNTLIQNKEPILAVKEKERISELENQIVDIIQKSKPKEDAIQKQITDESLLRGEQPEVGLQEVGKGNVQLEGPTTGTTEVTPTQPKQEKVTIGEYNPSEEVKDKDMTILNEVLSKKKVETVAEPDITDLGDNVVFEYYAPSVDEQGNELDLVTRLTFNKNENGGIVSKGVKVEQQMPRIKETKFFQDFVASQTQPTTEVSSKTPEQEVAQLKGLFGKKQATTDSGISVSDKTTVNNIKTKLADKAKTKIIESAQRGLTTLRSVLPDFDIIIHDNEGSYNAAVKTLNGTEGSKGNFAYNQKPDGTYSGRIDINLDKADGRTVAHEIFHGVMLQAFGENPKLFKAFKDRISKVLKDSTNKQLVDFANLYEGDVTYEEYLAELCGILEQQEDNISPSTLQKIAAIINEFVSKITNGALKPFEDIKNTKDIVDFFNTISESIRKGEEINTALFQAMQEGASISIGEPSTISRSQKGEKVKFSKTSPALSFVTEADKIDINKLIDDIIAKNQKVWFWMADQLGRGNYYDAVIKGEHYLDAGPSFALDPINRDKGVLWASGLSEKTLSDQIAKADYIFFISGSAEKAKLFNKRVLDLVAERINKKSNFKKFKAAMNGFKKETVELNTIKNALSNVNSFEELANSTKRKEFLISINQIGNLKTTPEGSLKELLNSFNAFVDYNELRDGFYRDNNFTQNDIMLIGKPTKVGGKAPHSTYENAILGEVVGVPDTKIDSWDIMPQDVKDAYTKGNKFIDSKTGKEKVRGELSVTQKAKVIAAETGVVRELKSKSQVDNRSKAIAVANTMGMNDKGFFRKDSNPSQLNNQLRQYGYSVKQARETPDGFGGGYYLVDEEGKKAIKTPTSKAQKVQEEVEQMQQSIPVPISKAQKGLINLTENDVLKYKRVGIEDKRTAQAMNQIGLSGVKFTKEEVDKKITEEFNKLIKDADSYIINEDSPAITQAIKAEITTLEDEGASLSRIESAKSALDENSPMRANFISEYARAQEETLSQWKSYLNQSDYSDAFKYIILDAVLTNNYDLKTGAYTKRSNKTIRNFTPFDAGTLASIYDSESKALLKDYVEVQSNNINNIVGANSMVSTKEGKWLKFEGGENAKDITGTANKLSQLVQNTYWCTKTNALSQLRGGDFYVYVTDDEKGEYVPRIAVRMEGNNVGEVRGNASSKQDLEPDMLPVADKFLKESIPNDSGKKWLDAIAYNNKVKDFTKKIENNDMSMDDILEYLDIRKDAKKYSVDYGENGLVTNLIEKIKSNVRYDNFTEDLRGKVAKNASDINETTLVLFSDLSVSFDDLSKVKNLKIITGNLDFEESEIESLGNLEVIGGDANFRNSDLEDLGNLKTIGGNANFGNSNVEDLGNLETIGGDAVFEDSNIESLGNLKSIGGGAVFRNSQIEDLGNLKSIKYNVYFEDSNIKSLGKLETIGRNANFGNSKVEDLGNLKTIGGGADFEDSNIKSLGKLETIGGDAVFRNSQIEDLGNLKSIKYNVYFRGTKIKSLGNLETIGRDANFKNSNVEDLGNLKSIGFNADFADSKIKSLGNLKSIGFSANFVNSNVKDLGKLKFIGGPLYSDNPVLNAQALDIKEKQSPISKAQLTDSITKVVKEARAQGFSEEAIKLFLEGEGIPTAEIKNAMAPETPASARVKISEKLSAGFDRMMGEVEGIIEKSKKRNVDQAKITENVLNYVMGSKVYENATDVQREKIIRDIKTKFGIRLKSAPSVAKLFGTLKDVKKFTLTEKQLYIKRLKDLQEGAKTAVAATKQAAILMAQEIKGLVKSGNITTRQAGFIISKFAKVNMLSPTSVSRFVDYMGKVFADAEYGAQINTAKGLRADIKKLSKNKDKNADFRKLAQEFINIDPSMVDDIYAYNEMASQIKSSVKGSTLRGEKVKFSEVVSIQDATRYISDTLRVQDKKILEEQRAEVQELMDIDASEMTPEQLRILLEGEGEVKVTKYNESIVRSLLDKAFKAYSGVIDEILKTGYDAFYTGEKVELTKNQKTLIKQFMDMDLTVLTPKESLQAVDALANFIQNQSTAKMETIVSDYTGRLNARKLAESKVKAQPLMKYKSKGFGKFLAEQTTTLPILFEKIFKGFNRSGEVMDMMGVTKLINGKSLAQNQSNMIVNDYVKQFFNKTANGEAFNTESNNVERGIASFMMRNVIGTEQEMKAEFNRRKNLLEESIEVLSKGNDLEQQKAALYQKAYDKILKDSKTIQEVKSKTDATNLEAIEFWTNQWADKYEELSDVSENVYNKILDKDINYTPDRFARISSDTGEVDLANDESAFHNNNGTIYKKETGVLMKATKPETLPTNKKNGKPTSYIELSFDKNNSNSMYDALVDMKTASAIRQIEAFENSADFEKIVPTADDAKILKDRVQLYVRNIRNKSPYSDDQFSKAVRNLNRLAAFGVGQALSGFGQPIKQMVPVLTNTLINAGSIDIMSGFNAAKQKFMSESGYGIANRGVESQAQIESLNKLIDSVPTGNFDKTIKAIEKINQKYLEFFLVNPDVFIARASWMSYYEKSLKKQGIDPNGVDYNTHELNEEAANYAQRMVDRQQNISDVDLSGKLFASKESANQVLVKMLMPFASFRMNQSARLGADLTTLADKTATAEDKKIATKSLAGFGVELATFKIVSAGIAITLGTLTKALMGQDEDEEEKDKRMNDVIKGQWTGTITDIISPLPVVDKPIQAAVETVSTLLEEGTGLPISTFGVSKSDWTSNLGTFGISAQRATELYDMSMLAATGEYTDDFNKKKTISSERQSQITYLLPFAMASNMGLAPSEVNTVIKNAVKYVKKNTKSTAEKAQAQENKEDRESTKQEKINALRTIIEESNDEAIIKQAKQKIDEVDADSEEKKIIKQENAQEKQAKEKLLVDTETGEEYDTESDLKRYNKGLWEQNFGEGSDWYESHKEEKEVESLLRKKVQQMKDEEKNYTGRNSDGSVKRFGASGTKKTQRFGASGKGKVKRFGS